MAGLSRVGIRSILVGATSSILVKFGLDKHYPAKYSPTSKHSPDGRERKRENMREYWCVVCEQQITGDDIDSRHTDKLSGEDCHSDCCLTCCRANSVVCR